MKAFIMPTLIILALIVFFVVIDRKEFKRYDLVQTDQRESVESNWKPAPLTRTETKPAADEKNAVETKLVAETKPVETKPATETKPVAETKTVAETKPVENKPATETKSVAETKTVAETKPVNKPVETKPVAATKTAVETKPATEIKPVAAAKTGDKNAPMAVPVVSPEEAEKLNAEALKQL